MSGMADTRARHVLIGRGPSAPRAFSGIEVLYVGKTVRPSQPMRCEDSHN